MPENLTEIPIFPHPPYLLIIVVGVVFILIAVIKLTPVVLAMYRHYFQQLNLSNAVVAFFVRALSAFAMFVILDWIIQ